MGYSNCVESYLAKIFPVWTIGMAMAEPDLLEGATDAQNMISKVIVIGRSSGFGDRSGFAKNN